MSLSRTTVIHGLFLLVSCGPEPATAADGTEESSSSVGEAETSSTSSGIAPDDLSWLVGSYTRACGSDSESPFVHGCKTDTSYELEFLPDGRMLSTRVFCGMATTQEETGMYRPGAIAGEAIIEPAAGFDQIYITGPVSAATARRSPDCMLIEVTTGAAGTLNTSPFVRGEFEYVPEPQGCSTEVVAVAVPECP